ncbi:alkene reductase [Pseudomonas sp. K1(2024)]|uniref:Alkene reductase n=1 Tax=Pseudomonas boreofloridensis TaxID=3064348 RepID=A0ABV4Z8M6_9PSED|nr:alkene reductase [Pseudomonas sp. K13]MDO7901507.1 alkene reductase [Pseudomonas sp. K13]
MTQHLLRPLQLGPFMLPHRIAMAPLTRSRADRHTAAPGPLNVEYYRQRASAALLITEATQISQQGQGYAWTPGIYTEKQVHCWRAVSQAVHQEKGLIFMQLWHVGRVSHPCFQPYNGRPVGPSALPVPGQTFILDANGNGTWADIPVPRELTIEEIAAIIHDYRVAARNALRAGMDGVEIHAGNGYLLDQFINSSSNQRNDRYGGSIISRVRLLLEVVEAVVGEIGAERVGVRMTPMGRFMGMGDETPEATFTYAARQLNRWPLAYLHLVEPAVVGTTRAEEHDPAWDKMMSLMRESWLGTLIVAGGYDPQSAEQALASGRADMIAFGRAFLANPDLPRRIREGLALNAPSPESFFGGDACGYTDYPLHP